LRKVKRTDLEDIENKMDRNPKNKEKYIDEYIQKAEDWTKI
jgi:hypothetical protein